MPIWVSDAEAAPRAPQLAQREMKKSKDYQNSPVYDRAHQLIYGGEPAIGPGDRPRIAVVVNGDERVVVEDRVKNEIYSQLRLKFPREYFALMKGTDVNTVLLQRAEDMYYDNRPTAKISERMNGSRQRTDADTNGVSHVIHGVGDFLFGERRSSKSVVVKEKEDRVDIDGLPVDFQPRGIADMRREDFVWAGQTCGYDYVFVVTLTAGRDMDYKHNFVIANSVTNHQNLWMRVRFVDVDSGNYLYRNDIAVQGKVHNGSRNGKGLQAAVHKAMEEAMNDLDFAK